MNKITLKNIKFSAWASQETSCFHADIYFNGKKIGYAENDGRGGSTYCAPYSIELKEIFKDAEDYCKSLPPIKYEPMYSMEAFEVQSNMEHVVDNLFEDWMKEKENKKMYNDFKKGICYTKDNLGYAMSTFFKGGKKTTIQDIVQTDSGLNHIKDFCNKKIKEGYTILNTNLPFILHNINNN